MNNVYEGDTIAQYKIIIGSGDKISKDYMMNPNNLFAEIKCSSVQKQTILGMLIPSKEKQSFVLLNFGAGHTKVSGNVVLADLATKALYQQWNKALSLNKILKELGADIVANKQNVDFDLSLNTLEKDTLISIFK